jgi:hypothetical protein
METLPKRSREEAVEKHETTKQRLFQLILEEKTQPESPLIASPTSPTPPS